MTKTTKLQQTKKNKVAKQSAFNIHVIGSDLNFEKTENPDIINVTQTCEIKAQMHKKDLMRKEEVKLCIEQNIIDPATNPRFLNKRTKEAFFAMIRKICVGAATLTEDELQNLTEEEQGLRSMEKIHNLTLGELTKQINEEMPLYASGITLENKDSMNVLLGTFADAMERSYQISYLHYNQSPKSELQICSQHRDLQECSKEDLIKLVMQRENELLSVAMEQQFENQYSYTIPINYDLDIHQKFRMRRTRDLLEMFEQQAYVGVRHFDNIIVAARSLIEESEKIQKLVAEELEVEREEGKPCSKYTLPKNVLDPAIGEKRIEDHEPLKLFMNANPKFKEMLFEAIYETEPTMRQDHRFADVIQALQVENITPEERGVIINNAEIKIGDFMNELTPTKAFFNAYIALFRESLTLEAMEEEIQKRLMEEKFQNPELDLSQYQPSDIAGKELIERRNKLAKDAGKLAIALFQDCVKEIRAPYPLVMTHLLAQTADIAMRIAAIIRQPLLAGSEFALRLHEYHNNEVHYKTFPIDLDQPVGLIMVLLTLMKQGIFMVKDRKIENYDLALNVGSIVLFKVSNHEDFAKYCSTIRYFLNEFFDIKYASIYVCDSNLTKTYYSNVNPQRLGIAGRSINPMPDIRGIVYCGDTMPDNLQKIVQNKKNLGLIDVEQKLASYAEVLEGITLQDLGFPDGKHELLTYSLREFFDTNPKFAETNTAPFNDAVNDKESSIVV